MKILYNTRDAAGKDFVKEVQIKQFPVHDIIFECPICNKAVTNGVLTKDIVSSNFTDWAYVGEFACTDCANLFSIYYYNYVIDPDGIHLYNVRELRDQLTTERSAPFLFVISTTQKKHLFYRAKWNYDSAKFAVNLETETIYTSIDRMRELFDFVECLQTLGCNKDEMKHGQLRYDVVMRTGAQAISYLRRELQLSREIQIPLYCGQKRNINNEEALCVINSILTA